jgi:hypothetical protein
MSIAERSAPAYSLDRPHSLPLIWPLTVPSVWSAPEVTDPPLLAEDPNFHKVERWTRDGLHITDLLYAGNDVEKAQDLHRGHKVPPWPVLYHKSFSRSSTFFL